MIKFPINWDFQKLNNSLIFLFVWNFKYCLGFGMPLCLAYWDLGFKKGGYPYILVLRSPYVID